MSEPEASEPMRRVVVLGVLIVAGLALAPSAEARLQPAITVSDGVATKQYPGLPAAFPSATDENIYPKPGDCLDPTPYCDTVPVILIPPKGTTENDELVVELSVSWNDPTGLNDVDIFVYDDKQAKKTDYTRITEAASLDNPEVVNFLAARLRKFNLVVSNYSGPNQGYKVTGRVLVNKFQTPFEALAPPSGGSGSTTDKPPAEKQTQPVDRSGGPPPASSTPTPTLGEVALPVGGGVDAAPAGDAAALETTGSSALLGGARPARADDHVSGLSLVLWLLAVPALVAAAVTALVLRSRRSTATLS